jgi:predicted transcriptional regulator
MVWFFGNKKQIEKLRDDVFSSFNHVKQDFNKVGEWIKHLDGKEAKNENEISDIKEQLLSIQNDLTELKDFISFFKPQLTQAMSKQSQTSRNKQTMSAAVQTPVQTPVQTDILDNLTVMERAIVWALLNSEMKLSYEDLAALLGKDKSTIRGQINVIKQKNDGLIEEYREITGKKRLYIPEDIRNRILKGVKIRVEGSKKLKKEKSESYEE